MTIPNDPYWLCDVQHPASEGRSLHDDALVHYVYILHALHVAALITESDYLKAISWKAATAEIEETAATALVA